nr:MAG TPA: hypothetical protein [Caudoviricetes sp.]
MILFILQLGKDLRGSRRIGILILAMIQLLDMTIRFHEVDLGNLNIRIDTSRERRLNLKSPSTRIAEITEVTSRMDSKTKTTKRGSASHNRNKQIGMNGLISRTEVELLRMNYITILLCNGSRDQCWRILYIQDVIIGSLKIVSHDSGAESNIVAVLIQSIRIKSRDLNITEPDLFVDLISSKNCTGMENILRTHSNLLIYIVFIHYIAPHILVILL